MKHNMYFGGRVQSLGFDGPGSAASVGVIGPGTYSFTTTGAEQVIVLTGSLAVRLPGEDWRSVHAPGAYVVPPATTFEVSADSDVSYLCRFAAPTDKSSDEKIASKSSDRTATPLSAGSIPARASLSDLNNVAIADHLSAWLRTKELD